MDSGEVLAKVLLHYGLVGGASLNDTFKIVCPLHGDVNASMQINLSEGTYFCFGCQARGDAYKLVQSIEGCSSLEAIMKATRIANGSSAEKIIIRKGDVKSDKQLLRDAKLFFYSLPKTDWQKEKGSYLQKRGFSAKVLNTVDAKINFNNDYGVVLPMVDFGRFKGWVCRKTSKNSDNDRKYLYNKGFRRRETLVGDYGKDWVIICEGYLDWLKFKQHGINNVVAILGWKITAEQIKKLKLHTEKVISALDNTPMGRKGTSELAHHFYTVRFAFPPNVKDPGDLDDIDFARSWSATVKKVAAIDNKINTKHWR